MNTKSGVTGLLIVWGLFLSACTETDKEKSAAVEELTATCEALTQADNEGHVYDAIIGRYAQHKSHEMSAKPAAGPLFYANVITFEGAEEKETTLYSQNMSESDFKETYKPILQSVLYDSMKNNDFEDYIFGMCGYKNAEGKYMDKIETLTLIYPR